jgi:hypothetical protein
MAIHNVALSLMPAMSHEASKSANGEGDITKNHDNVVAARPRWGP